MTVSLGYITAVQGISRCDLATLYMLVGVKVYGKVGVKVRVKVGVKVGVKVDAKRWFLKFKIISNLMYLEVETSLHVLFSNNVFLYFVKYMCTVKCNKFNTFY